MAKDELQIPLTEKLKSIPDFFGLNFNEQPKFTLMKEDGAFEIRQYEPLLIAKTTVEGGDFEKANEEAFMKLAGYIFGKNKTSETLPMTSPVLKQEGQKIPMTSFVLQDLPKTKDAKGLTMSFVLPSEITAKTAPIPLDSSIQIQEIPAQTWAVVKFSGRNGRHEIEEKSQELQKWLVLDGQKVDLETMRVAQYDSPSTIPFLRKNEVQIRLWSSDIH